MNLLEQAIAHAANVHAGQVDKCGEPYILHPLRLMLACKTDDERITAVLHDVMEDGTVDDSLWVQLNMPLHISAAVVTLTKRPYEPYKEYIARCAANPIARVVKLADLADNMDLSRIPKPTEQDHSRMRKYAEAKAFLENYNDR